MNKGYIERPESLSNIPVRNINNLFGKKMSVEGANKNNQK
jgi:hypothetical protein